MTYQELVTLARRNQAAILLEERFGTKLRRALIALSSFGLWGTVLFLVALTLPTIKAALPAHIELTAYVPLALAIACFSAVWWLCLLGLELFSLSAEFDGLTESAALANIHARRDQAAFSLQRLVYKAPENPYRALLESTFGQNLLRRLEIEKINRKALYQSAPRAESFTLPSVPMLHERHLALTCYQDKAFSEWLFHNGVSESEWRGGVAMVERLERVAEAPRRFWSRESLGRIPGIGTDWSYGGAYLLKRFSEEVAPLSTVPMPHIEKASRDTEVVLARAREANVLVVGTRGGGLEEVAQTLAADIAKRQALGPLEHRRIHRFDFRAFAAAHSEPRLYESTLYTLFADAAQAGNILIYLDDVSAFRASAQGLGVDPFKVIDPIIGGAGLQVLAAVSHEEYTALRFEPTLSQRFEVVTLPEPDHQALTRIAAEAIPALERTYGVYYTYEAVAAAGYNATHYISEPILPDTVLDLLAEAGPYTRGQKQRVVREAHINALTTTLTGIPTPTENNSERNHLLNLETEMQKRVIGQDEALEAVASALRRSRSGVGNPERPLGSFLFAGPTGVGKTEVARTLARVLFEDENNLIRLDMSEYRGNDALEKLIGSFTAGSEGVLTTALRQSPYGILLLDEFEKAAPAVMDVFLPLLDEGYISDGTGRRINARNVIIIATSNAGADFIWERFQAEGGNLHDSNLKDTLLDRWIESGIFKPEFLNRFDDVIIFSPLSEAARLDIARILLAKLSERFEAQEGVRIIFSEETIQKVANVGSNPQFGARPMQRYIQDTIENEVAKALLAGQTKPGMTLTY